MTTHFDDRFGNLASHYTARPHYPDALFQWLARNAPSHQWAWDCGCGSGQASHDLSRRFRRVIATDASQNQIGLASPSPRVAFQLAAAEASGQKEHFFDLIFVGIAAHWFNLPAFYDEACRVAKPGALLALVTYGNAIITNNPAANALLQKLSTDVRPYGAPELSYVRDEYRSLPFPFPNEIHIPNMNMEASMTSDMLSSYLRSRSPVKKHNEETQSDIVAAFEGDLKALGLDKPLRVIWPLRGRAARLTAIRA